MSEGEKKEKKEKRMDEWVELVSSCLAYHDCIDNNNIKENIDVINCWDLNKRKMKKNLY